MSMQMYDAYGLPGIAAVKETQEQNFIWDLGQGIPNAWRAAGVIVGTARDTGNTPTTLLRPGLLMGKITSTGKLKEWNPTGTDGSEYVHSILQGGRFMQDSAAADMDKWLGYLIVGGPVEAANILIPGQSAAGLSAKPAGMLAMAQMRGRFVFDGDFIGNGGAFLGQPKKEIVKTANYSVLEADNGCLFTNLGDTGAITFTLPAITNAAGLSYEFYCAADFTLTVAAAAADTMIAVNDLAASSVAFATVGQKIGGHLRVWHSPNAAKWMVSVLSVNPLTVTA